MYQITGKATARETQREPNHKESSNAQLAVRDLILARKQLLNWPPMGFEMH